MNVGNTIISGILVGCIYASVGLGFSLIWGIMNIVNLAQGSLLVLGGYVAYFAAKDLGIDPFLSVPIAMVVLFVVGWLIQSLTLNRVIRAPFLVTFMLTFGLDLVITNLMEQNWGTFYGSVTPAYAGVHFDLGFGTIPLIRAIAAIIAILLTVALSIFLGRTRTGNAILATGMDRDAARLMGISVARVYALTFGLGAALAAAAGALIMTTTVIRTQDTGTYTLYAFVVVALGGLGTPWAAVAGGLLLGIVHEFFGAFPQTVGLEDAIAFAMLALVLVIRPSGLLGKAFYS